MKFVIRHEVPGRLRLDLSNGLPSAAAVAGVEKAVRALRSVRSARVGSRTNSLLVAYEPGESARRELLDAIVRLEPADFAGPPGPPENDEVARQRGALVRSAVMLFLGQALVGPAKLALSLYGALPFFRKGLDSLLSMRIDAELLDAVAIGTASRIGDHRTASVISFLLRLGEYLKLKTESRARSDLAGILARQDRNVWVRREGKEVQVKAKEVAVGEVVVLRRGYTVPVDGHVVAGRALVDQSSLTGEGTPARKRKGAMVFEGTTVAEGWLDVEASKVGDETRMATIVNLVDRASTQKARSEQRASHLADKLVPYVFSVAGATQAATWDPERAASVLLVDYSCALKLSVPIAIKTCLIEALKHGVLIRGGKFIEALAEADTVVFDKTGTLTEARPAVVDVVPAPGFDRATLLKETACVEEHFPHPVATAIVQEAIRQGLAHGDEDHGRVRSLVSYGIVSSVHGKRFVVGSRRLLAQEGIGFGDAGTAVERAGRSVVYVGVDGRFAGAFLLEDALRPEVEEVLAALKRLGVRRTILLTGDNDANARRVARLGFDEYHAEVSPEDKARIVQALRASGRTVAMVGDGMNDAPALSVANVGISFEHGTDVARETADVLLLRPDLRRLPWAIRIARLATLRVGRNFRLIVGVNSAIIGNALLGRTSPALAALAHNLTTVVTSVRSLRPYMPAERADGGVAARSRAEVAMGT